MPGRVVVLRITQMPFTKYSRRIIVILKYFGDRFFVVWNAFFATGKEYPDIVTVEPCSDG